MARGIVVELSDEQRELMAQVTRSLSLVGVMTRDDHLSVRVTADLKTALQRLADGQTPSHMPRIICRSRSCCVVVSPSGLGSAPRRREPSHAFGNIA